MPSKIPIFLVTGGAGFIGSHLVEALVTSGACVRILDDFSTGAWANIAHMLEHIEVVEADVRDRDAVRKVMQGVDRVCHLAALVSVPKSIEDPGLSFSINVQGTQIVLDEARKAGVDRVVLASSAAVYGASMHLPLEEGACPDPLSPYGLDKLQAEQLGRMYANLYGMPVTALRFFNVFGPRQDPSSPYSGVISIFIRRMLNGETVTIFGDGGQTRDFIYVKDLVHAISLAIHDDTPGFQLFNVGTGKQSSINELYSTLSDIMQAEPADPAYAPARDGDIRHSQADISHISRALGFTPCHSLEQGLRATADSVREADRAEHRNMSSA